MTEFRFMTCIFITAIISGCALEADVDCTSPEVNCISPSHHIDVNDNSDTVLLQVPYDTVMKKHLQNANRELKQSIGELRKLEVEDAILKFRTAHALRTALRQLKTSVAVTDFSKTKKSNIQKQRLHELDDLLIARPSVTPIQPGIHSKFDSNFAGGRVIHVMMPLHEKFNAAPISLETGQIYAIGNNNLLAQLHDQAILLRGKLGHLDGSFRFGENDANTNAIYDDTADDENEKTNDEIDEENDDGGDDEDDDHGDDDDENLVAELMEQTAAFHERITTDAVEEDGKNAKSEEDNDDDEAEDDELGETVDALKTLAAENEILQVRVSAAVLDAVTKLKTANAALSNGAQSQPNHGRLGSLQKMLAATLDEMEWEFGRPVDPYDKFQFKKQRITNFGNENNYNYKFGLKIPYNDFRVAAASTDNGIKAAYDKDHSILLTKRVKDPYYQHLHRRKSRRGKSKYFGKYNSDSNQKKLWKLRQKDRSKMKIHRKYK